MGTSNSKGHSDSVNEKMKKNASKFVKKGKENVNKLWKNIKIFKKKQVSSQNSNGVVSLNNNGFCFETLSRFQSVLLLNGYYNTTGTFLIRKSETYPGKLVLSVLCGNRVIHFLIRKCLDKYYFIRKNEAFLSIKDLIAYYSKSDNCRKIGYLFKLKKWIKPKHLAELVRSGCWKDGIENIKLQWFIGSGEMGEIYSALWRNKVDVAFKQAEVKKYDVIKANRIMNDAEIMLKLRNINILKLVCVLSLNDKIYTVTEPINNGLLIDYLRNDINKANINLRMIVEMASQIADAMKHLHSKGYVHCDLNASSVFVNENNNVKLGSFYFAKKLNENNEVIIDDDHQLPVKWTAPEVFDTNNEGTRVYTKEADIWSFGILLYVLITCGEEPYPGIPSEEVLEKVKTHNYRLSPPSGLCTNNYYKIMGKCWQSDPKARPDFKVLHDQFSYSNRITKIRWI